MPGANYMGGQRNTVKARAKDTVGRQQKGYFGRQRLDILSKGISALRPSELAHTVPGAISAHKYSARDIDLSHARTKLPLKEISYGRSFIPSPVYISPSSPRSWSQTQRKDAHTSSSNADRSEILDALDTSDPVFLRGVMNEILAMPDLACLSKRSQHNSTGSVKSSRHVGEIIGYNKNFSNRDGTNRKFFDIVEKEKDSRRKFDFESRYLLSSKQIRYPPSSVEPHRQNASSDAGCSSCDLHHERRIRRAGVSSKPSGAEVASDSSEDLSLHDSGFMEFDIGDLRDSNASPSWSAQRAEPSSPVMAIVSDDTVDSTARYGNRRMSGTYLKGNSDEDKWMRSPRDQPFLPSLIAFKPQNPHHYIGGEYARQDEPSVYGSLFEQEDPWSAIGVILGLPETEGTTEILDVIAPVREVGEDPWDSPCDELNLPWEKDNQDFDVDDDWDCQFSVLRPQKRASDVHSAPNSKKSSHLPVGLPQHGLDTTLPVGYDINFVVQDVSQEDLVSEKTLSGIQVWNNQDNIQVDLQDVTAALSEAMGDQSKRPADAGNSETPIDADYSHQLLELPVLDEVDGHFLGPSLFNTFDESDDE